MDKKKKTYTKALKEKKRRLFFPQKRYWAILLPFGILAGLFYYYILRDLPSPTKLSSDQIPQSTQIFDRHDTLLYTIYGKRNQTFVPLSTIPKTVQEATIAIEDRSFYSHGPIDIRGTLRALYETALRKQTQGGSTLTQQLVKNTLLETNERTILRKLREATLAFATEVIYPKNKILEMYLNQTPYGGTAWGIEAAALTYFGKHAKQLDLAESALLAGLPQSPTTYSPFGAHPELAKYRQVQVLDDMQQQGYITKKQRDQAVNEELHYQKFGTQILAPHFVLWIKQLLEDKYGDQVVSQGGLQVKTSLDLSLQNYAQATVAAEVANVASDHVTNGAALITNPGTGEILAMVGSKNYYDSNGGNVNIVTTERQPGSAMKPFNYAVGLMKGYTAASTFIDEATCFPDQGGKSYCPHNYDNSYHGLQTMRNALGNSLNIPAVKMLKANGIDAFIATASAMGITSLNDPRGYGLSLTLGGAEVSMLDMVTAYGVLANGGYRIDMHPILKITDRNGKVLEEYHTPSSPIFGKKVLPSGVSYIISDILADNNARLMDFGPDNALKIDKKYVSAKTGTTNDFRDNWTFGYTPKYVVGVWVGNNDNSPMNGLASGITGAAPIWHDLMSHLLENENPQRPQPPSDVVQSFACDGPAPTPAQGDTTGQNNPPPSTCSGHNEYFIKGTEHKTTGGYSTEKVWIDKTTGAQGAPGQTDNIELRDETFITDPSGAKYCITCAHPTPSPTPSPPPH